MDFLQVAEMFGATGTIKKPFTISELIKLIESPLRGHT
jgi:hypothetical protein